MQEGLGPGRAIGYIPKYSVDDKSAKVTTF